MKIKRHLKRRKQPKPYLHWKHRRPVVGTCPGCGRELRRRPKNPNGKCCRCNLSKHPRETYKCAECGKATFSVYHKTGNLCWRCFRKIPKPRAVCKCCGREFKIEKRNRGNGFCGQCNMYWDKRIDAHMKRLKPLYPISKGQLEIEDVRVSLKEWLEIERHHERLHMVLDAMAAKLTAREKSVVEYRYGIGDGLRYTLEETAKIFKVTKERIRQLEFKALRKVRFEVEKLEAQVEGYVRA